MPDPIIPPVKRCSKCGIEKPDVFEYFRFAKGCRNGLSARCRECDSVYKKDYRARNKEKIAADAIRYRIENPDKVYGYAARYREENRECIREKGREYYRENSTPESRRAYRLRSAESIKAYNHRYHKNNPHIGMAQRSRRRAKVLNLPNKWTSKDWLYCLDYFRYRCAVCESQLRDLFGNVEPHADHWIPLNSPDCVGTVPKNMVCLCSPCNLSKSDTLPDVWLVKKFGKRKTAEILKRIEVYFEQVKK